MNINNAFPSKWLKSGDLGDEDLTLTIRAVEVEEIGSGEDAKQKPVLYFEETDKGMVLNKTNASTIAGLHTPETDNWPGKKITLFATEVDYGGKQTLAIRVRMRKPTPKPAQSNTTGNEGADEMAGPTLLQRYGALYAQATELGIEAEYVEPPISKARLVEMGKALKAKIDEAPLG